ncbi:MAG: cation:dicarboxylase symporter family transporter, partial [Thermodesulfobacteriota bacterium]
ENIFHSLYKGSSLQILFFALILGIATGFLPEIEGRLILSFSESLFKAFFGIISWILYLLPVGLFCLVSSQVARTGIDILVAMTKFVVIVWITSLLVIALCALLIWYTTGAPPWRSFVKLKDCLLIGFGTQSTFASMPSQLDGLQGLKVNAELANLVVPIGAVICRFSMVITYAVTAIFTAQLYDVSLTMGNLITGLFLAVLAAVAGAGTPGIVSIAMVAIVLGPLGLPSEAVIALLLAINPVIEPITTMANVHANCSATTLVAKGMGTIKT